MKVHQLQYLKDVLTSYQDQFDKLESLRSIAFQLAEFGEWIFENLSEYIESWEIDYQNLCNASIDQDQEMASNMNHLYNKLEPFIGKYNWGELYSAFDFVSPERLDIGVPEEVKQGDDKSKFEWQLTDLISEHSLTINHTSVGGSYYDNSRSGQIGRIMDSFYSKISYLRERKVRPTDDELRQIRTDLVKAVNSQEKWYVRTVHQIQASPYFMLLQLNSLLEDVANISPMRYDKGLQSLVDRLFKIPKKPFTEMLHASIHNIVFQKSSLQLSFVKKQESEEKQNSRYEKAISEIKEFITRFIHRVITLLGERKNRLIILQNYKYRCEAYDQPFLRDLIFLHTQHQEKKNAKKNRVEDTLKSHLATYLFDNGLNPMTEFTTRDGKNRYDIYNPMDPFKFLIETKAISSNPKTAVVEGLKQLIEYYQHERSRSQETGFFATLVLFLTDGSPLGLPDEIEAEELVIRLMVVDIRNKPSSKRKQGLVKMTREEILGEIYPNHKN